jgi:hypothetical protein
VQAVVQTQRSATMRTLQQYTRLKANDAELPWRLVLESLIFQAEAELRWLDHCESSLLRYVPTNKPAQEMSAAQAIPEVARERA